jgi:hypothetical protein
LKLTWLVSFSWWFSGIAVLTKPLIVTVKHALWFVINRGDEADIRKKVLGKVALGIKEV